MDAVLTERQSVAMGRRKKVSAKRGRKKRTTTRAKRRRRKQKGRGWFGGVGRVGSDVYNTLKMASAVARNAPKKSIFRRTAMMRYGNPWLEKKLYKRQ